MMFKTLLFSMSIQIFVTSFVIFVKIEICVVKIIHFIIINMTLDVIFMILEKSLFVSSDLKVLLYI
jgi:hypothetical protein